MKAPAVLILAGLWAAGCVEAPPEAAPAAFGAPERSTETPTATVAVINATDAPDPGPTVLDWEVVNRRGPFAVQLVVAPIAQTSCEFSVASSTKAHGGGVTSAMTVRSGTSRGWSAGGSGYLAHAHAGTVDTRTLTPADGHSASLRTFRWSKVSGDVTLEMIFSNLQPFPSGSPTIQEWLPKASVLRVHLECAEPIQLRSLSSGAEVLMFNEQTMSGGAGANVGFEASANVNDGAGRRTSLPTTIAMMGSFGYQAGNFEWRGPAGTKACGLDPVSFSTDCRLEGGPGQYSATLTRVGVYFDAFWAAIFAVEPVDGLDVPAPPP